MASPHTGSTHTDRQIVPGRRHMRVRDGGRDAPAGPLMIHTVTLLTPFCLPYDELRQATTTYDRKAEFCVSVRKVLDWKGFGTGSGGVEMAARLGFEPRQTDPESVPRPVFPEEFRHCHPLAPKLSPFRGWGRHATTSCDRGRHIPKVEARKATSAASAESGAWSKGRRGSGFREYRPPAWPQPV